jgi:hypothetical protein
MLDKSNIAETGRGSEVGSRPPLIRATPLIRAATDTDLRSRDTDLRS